MKTKNLNLAVVALVALVGGCADCLHDPKVLSDIYHWAGAEVTVYDPGVDFDPRWFPMANAKEVAFVVDRDKGEVTFTYMLRTTEVTEVWKITDLSKGEVPREECQD